MSKIEYTIREKEVTIEYVVINDKELRLGKTLDFLEKVEGATTFDSFRWQREYDRIADTLIEVGIVGRTNPGSWYVENEKEREELYEELLKQYYPEN